MKNLLKITLLLALIAWAPLSMAQEPSRYGGKTNNWYKGNTHTHTNIGTDETGKLYHDADYDFLALTEHNRYLGPDDVSFSPRRENFLIIPGEEFDSSPYGSKHTSVVNSTGKVGSLSGTGYGGL